MAQPVQPTQARTWTASRLLMLAGAILFVLAALSQGLSWSISPWCFGFGAFAAWMLAGAV